MTLVVPWTVVYVRKLCFEGRVGLVADHPLPRAVLSLRWQLSWGRAIVRPLAAVQATTTTNSSIATEPGATEREGEADPPSAKAHGLSSAPHRMSATVSTATTPQMMTVAANNIHSPGERPPTTKLFHSPRGKIWIGHACR
jgi:hypothetical protein